MEEELNEQVTEQLNEQVTEQLNEQVTEPAKTIKTKLVCPHCNTEIIIEKPASTRTRGSLQGIALKDMTLEQLKREKINASSVLYKATKRGAAPELIANNQVRLDAVVAELAIRQPKAVVVSEVVEEVVAEQNETAEY